MARKPPVNNAFGNIGALGSLLAIPCTPSIQIWASTLTVSFLAAFWTFLQPVWKQDIKLLTGKSWLHNLRQQVNESEFVNPLFTNGNTEVLFEIAEIADGAVWWIFIGGFTLEFLLDWTTMAYRTEGCLPGQRTRTYSGIAPTGTSASTTDWAGVVWLQTTPTPGGFLPSVLVVPAGQSGGSINAALTAKDLLSGKPIAIRTRVRDVDTGAILDQDDQTQDGANQGNAAINRAPLPFALLSAQSFVFEWQPVSLAGFSVAVCDDGRITMVFGGAANWL